MEKIKSFFIRIVFGKDFSKDDYIPFTKNSIKELLSSKTMRIDIISIAFFLGKWLPYSVAIGITTGTIAAIMDYIVIYINSFLSKDIIFFFIYPLFVAYIAGKVVKHHLETAGPGIGYSILHLKTKDYLPIKSIVYKLLISVITLSGGFIAGREGPSFFLGVGIGEWVGRIYGFSKRFKNILALIGAGSFTGALLKAPLGSSLFAMELENMYDFNYRPFIPMIVASIVSYLTFSFFRGNHAFIQLVQKPFWTLDTIPYIIGMGLVISAIIYLYTLVFHFFVKFSDLIPIRRRLFIGTTVAVVLMAILYILTKNSEIFSAPVNMKILSTIAQTKFNIFDDVVIIIFTILITSFTLAFGIPGGLILPVLIIGAATGNIFGHIFPKQLVMFTLAGMGAALSAGAKTPLAAIVMITEMSHDDVVIPMTAAVIISYLTSFGYSLYLGQKNIFRGNLKDFKAYAYKLDNDHI